MSFTADLTTTIKQATASLNADQQYWSAPAAVSKEHADTYEGVGTDFSHFYADPQVSITMNMR